MLTSWKKLSERVEKVGWRTILHRVFAHPNGKEVECTIVERGQGVATLALTPEGKVIVCRQFRPGPEKVLYEVSAGGVEEGEGLFEAAARELREETGYAGKLEYVGHCYPWGWGGLRMHIFLAEDCIRVGDIIPDGIEVIEVEIMSMETFRSLARAGREVHPYASCMAIDFLDWKRHVKALGKEPRRVACCLLRDGDRFLFQHRTDDAPRDPGKWGVFGGHLWDDETPADAIRTPLEAVKREILEEVGYKLAEPELLFVHRDDEVEASIFTEAYDPAQPLVQTEGQDMRWCTFGEAFALDLCDLDRAMLERLVTVWHDAEDSGI